MIAILKPKPPETKLEIHKTPCKNCPSAYFPPDPEVIEILKLPHEQRVQTAFACGWRQTKYCRGYCDLMGITQDDIKAKSAYFPVLLQ